MELDDQIYKYLKKGINKCHISMDVPVSAVIVKDNKVICYAWNRRNKLNSVLGHAEIDCIIKAEKKLHRWNLSDCEMYVTLEPCSMCKNIISSARISKVYYFLAKDISKKEYNSTQFLLKNNELSRFSKENLNSFFLNLRTK